MREPPPPDEDATRALDELLASSRGGAALSASSRGLVARALVYASRRARESGALIASDELLAEAHRFDDGSPRLAAELALARASEAYRTSRLEDVEREAELALACARDLADGGLEARAHLMRATAYVLRQDLEAAELSWESAATNFRALGQRDREMRVWLTYAFALLDEEQAERAREVFDQAEALADELGDALAAARARGYIGNVLRYQGRYREAAAAYEDALARLVGEVSGTWRATFRMDLGLSLLVEGRDEDATHLLELAASELEDGGFVRLHVITLAALSVCRARLGDRDAARTKLAEAERRLAGTQDAGLVGILACYRAAARTLLEKTQVEHEAEPAPTQHGILARRVLDAARASLDDSGSWRVARDGALVLAPTNERVTLERRPLLARLVRVLTEARLSRPGSALSLEELFAGGWPDERALPAAIANRVRVAVSTLRKAGLRDLLCSDGAGYRLRDDVAVQWLPGPGADSGSQQGAAAHSSSAHRSS